MLKSYIAKLHLPFWGKCNWYWLSYRENVLFLVMEDTDDDMLSALKCSEITIF